MRITSKGQVTIPLDIRNRLGFLPDTDIEFIVEKGRAYIAKKSESQKRGKALIRHLEGKCKGRMSTDEIMALTRGES